VRRGRLGETVSPLRTVGEQVRDPEPSRDIEDLGREEAEDELEQEGPELVAGRVGHGRNLCTAPGRRTRSCVEAGLGGDVENRSTAGPAHRSGRTGGVAWTGLSTHPSNGGAILSTFTGNTYGAFVTRGHDVRFSGDLFESNQLDGLHFHRDTIGSSASYSAAVRNGANGFHVDRATSRTVLQHDLSQHNATNGFLVDGRPLVVSASASGII